MTIEYEDGISLELRHGDGSTVYIEPDALTNPETNREPNAMSEFTVQIPRDEGAEDWHNSEVYLWYTDGEDRRLLFRGELTDTSHRDGRTTLSGPDFIKDSDRGAAIVTVENELAVDAIQNFFDEYLSHWDVTVHPADPETIDEALVVQDATTTLEFEDITTIDDTDPFEVVNDEVELLQSCFPQDGTDYTASNAINSFVNSDFSGSSPDACFGSSVLLTDVGDYAEWQFTIDYEWQPDNWDLQIRYAGRIDDPGFVDVEWTVNGGNTFNFASGTNENVFWSGALYEGEAPGDPPTLQPGTHTIRAEVVDKPGDGNFWIDHIAPHDTRFSYNFDNDVTCIDGTNYLDGPELKPDFAFLSFDAFDQAFNIEKAHMTATVDETTSEQALQATLDGGDTWLPASTPEQTTIETTADFGAAEIYGTIVQARLGIGRTSPNGAQDATPRYGYDGQTVDSFELAIDTNSLAVFDDAEFVGTPFEVLNDMVDESGKLYTAIYEEDAKAVEVFDPGQVTKPTEWRVIEEGERSTSSFEYGNSLTVLGARDDETDERLTATAESQTEIDARGEIEAPALFESDIDNPDRLANIARTQLARYVNADRLEGDLVATPIDVPPGFAYPVDHLDGQETTLWSAGLSRGQTALDFSAPEDLISAVLSIRTRVRRREI